MEKIIAIIERADDGGFSIYSNEVSGLVGTGLTEQEAREDFMLVKDEQAEFHYERTGEHPDWENAEVEFTYSLSAFFMAFPYINATQFAHAVGINPSLMRKYKMGLATASDKQKQIIQSHLNELTEKLQHVQFA